MGEQYVNCCQCGGCGWQIDQGCCGNYLHTGECVGYCSVPVQRECSQCNGGGVIELQHEEQKQ